MPVTAGGAAPPATRFHAEYAWLGPGSAPASGVLIEITGGRFSSVTAGVTPAPAGATHLPGLTLPGLANAHSHAFHRALRGRSHTGKGTFWTWRERMYALAERLTPDSYRALARATFAEMALAGVACVGEFHYLHHGPGGTPYGDPNEMSYALVEAAAEAGIRITLLDACYLTAGVDEAPLQGPQRRFGDGDVAGWARRLAAFTPDQPHVMRGAAIHSIRAVPAGQIPDVVAATHGLPLHVHLSEQVAENEACLVRYGRTPTELLLDAGALDPAGRGAGTTAVHATHLTDTDRAELGDRDTGVCLCPTTERDLADGIGPARALADAGSPLSLGSDSHAVIDLFEEARAVELDERLQSHQRGHFAAAELLTAATSGGHQALGWTDAGMISPGARADLVTVRLDSVRTAGFDPVEVPAAVLFAATAADVHHVVVDGRVVVRDGRHTRLDVPASLTGSILQLWRD